MKQSEGDSSHLRPRAWRRHPSTAGPHPSQECAQGGARVGSPLSAGREHVHSSLCVRTPRKQRPRPLPRGLGGPAQEFRSRAAAPPNQRPLHRGSRFKLQLRVFVEVRLAWPPPPLADHGAPHRGTRAVPGHQAGKWAGGGLGQASSPTIPRPSRRLVSLRLPRAGRRVCSGTCLGRGGRSLDLARGKDNGAGSPGCRARGVAPETLAVFSAINGTSQFEEWRRAGAPLLVPSLFVLSNPRPAAGRGNPVHSRAAPHLQSGRACLRPVTCGDT